MDPFAYLAPALVPAVLILVGGGTLSLTAVVLGRVYLKVRQAQARIRTPERRKLSADARWQLLEQRFLVKLAKTNPAEYAQYMKQRAGFGQGDPLTNMIEMTKRMREAGFIKSGSDLAGEDDMDPTLKKMLPLLVPLGMSIAAKAMGLPLPTQDQEPQPQSQADGTVQVVEPEPPRRRKPRKQLRQAQAPQELPEPGDDEDGADEEPPEPATRSTRTNGAVHLAPGQVVISNPAPPSLTSTASQVLVVNLAGKTPEQAAEWLAGGMEFPAFRQVLEVLLRTPSEQLPDWLEQLARANPDLRGFVDWLSPQMPWFVETLRLFKLQVRTARTGG